MPQQLHVVRCSNCEIFQVDIVKKIPKWLCKMCGEKQSLKKVYGTGTGKECREFVQDLNRQRLSLQAPPISGNLSDISHTECKQQLDISTCINQSKWSEYVSKNEDNIDEKLNVNTNVSKWSDISKSEDNVNERLNNFNNTNVESKWSKYVSKSEDNGDERLNNLGNDIIYYNKPITLNKKLSSATRVSKSNLNPHNGAEVENEDKLGSCDISQYDNEYEQDITGSNSIIEVSKKRLRENTEEKFNKWKKFLSNEYYSNTSYLKCGEADDKSSQAQITVLSNISNSYCNKFGDSSNLDIDLEF